MQRRLFILLLTTLAVSQSSVNIPANCVCDVTQNSCDAQCCCDASCNTQLIANWKAYSQCLPANNNGLAIPSCDDKQNIHISDMNSGLRTIYSVIKRLFCLYRANANISLAVNSYFTANSVRATIDSLTNNFKRQQYVSPYNSFLRSAGFTVPTRGIGGRCSLETTYFGLDKQFIRCNTQINSSLLLDTSYNSLMFGGASANPTKFQKNGSVSSRSSSCTTTNCIAAVTSATIELVMSGSDPASSTLSAVNIQMIVEDITLNYSTVSQTFQTYWTTTDNVRKSSSVGYKMGSPLIVVNSINISKLSPILINFRDSVGACSATSQQLIDIRFGQDLIIMCAGDGSSLKTPLSNTFSKISKFGSILASQNTKDYVTVENAANSNMKNIDILEISYSRIGTQKNSMYEVVLARLIKGDTNSASGIYKLAIEFKEIANTPVDYVPPPPTAELYLPNDVLYPFYVSQ